MMVTEISYLVLDKDFLEGCRCDDLESIARSGNRFIVIAETYVEVCTTDDLREQLLRKLHRLSKHIDILDHVGTLYKYEIDNLRPCCPVSEHFVYGRFNPNFSLQFTDEQRKAIEDEKTHLESNLTSGFKDIVKEVMVKSHELNANDICQVETIRQVYNWLRAQDSKLPPAELLDEQWALYRKVQMDLLVASRYAPHIDAQDFWEAKESRSHDQIDFRVCIVGALVGGLATRDGGLRTYFQTICPTGRVVP